MGWKDSYNYSLTKCDVEQNICALKLIQNSYKLAVYLNKTALVVTLKKEVFIKIVLPAIFANKRTLLHLLPKIMLLIFISAALYY